MSAFICGKQTFATIYTGLKVYGTSHAIWYSPIKQAVEKVLTQYGSLEAIIEQLYALNVRAVNQRYREHTEERMPGALLDTEWKGYPSLFQFLKSLECLEYQMSEGSVPQEELYRLLHELISAVALYIVRMDTRYTEAEWR